MTDPETRIVQLERDVRCWKRVALIMIAAFLLLVVGSAVLLTRGQIMVERERRIAEDSRQMADKARDEANVQRAFLEKELHGKTK
jgi:hypothetical protein